MFAAERVTTPVPEPELPTLTLVVPEITPLTVMPPVLAALSVICPPEPIPPLIVSKFDVVLITDPPPLDKANPRVKVAAAPV